MIFNFIKNKKEEPLYEEEPTVFPYSKINKGFKAAKDELFIEDNIEGKRYLLYDAYCVNPTCLCAFVLLTVDCIEEQLLMAAIKNAPKGFEDQAAEERYKIELERKIAVAFKKLFSFKLNLVDLSVENAEPPSAGKEIENLLKQMKPENFDVFRMRQREAKIFGAGNPKYYARYLKMGEKVLYSQIDPSTEPFTFEYDGMFWVVDDCYCIDPDCACDDTTLIFSKVDIALKKQTGSFEYEYQFKGLFRLGQSSIPKSEAMAVREYFFNTQKDLLSIFKRRKEKARELGRRVLKAMEDERQKRFLAPDNFQVEKKEKIGRNAPCPCGSGKKYKKCCLPREQA